MESQTAPEPIFLCDFCNDSVIQIRTFEVVPLSMKVRETVVYFCDSRWAACPICAQMIDENRWDDLTGRSYDLWLKAEIQRGANPGFASRQFMKMHVAQLHQLFREACGRTA